MKQIILAPLLLWSSFSFANIESNFKVLDGADFPVKKDEISVSNLPKVRSQGGFGSCVGFTTSTVAQHFLCKENNIKNCANLPDSKLISPFHMLGFSFTTNDRAFGGDLDSHSHTIFGGFSDRALNNLTKAGLSHAESCYPYDQLVRKYGNDNKTVDKMLERLQALYKKNKSTEAGSCVDCVKKAMQTDMFSRATTEDIETALRAKTFEEFLYHATIGAFMDTNGCEDIVEIDPPAKAETYPPKNVKKTYESSMQKIKDVLKNGNIIAMDGICPYVKNKSCTGKHSVVITGYRKQCTTSGDCRDLIRVHNSWGQEWQQRNNDGWVDAQSLIGKDAKDLETLSWLVRD